MSRMNWKSDQSYFSQVVGEEIWGWKDSTLWEAVEKLQVEDIPLRRFGTLKFDFWDCEPGDQELASHLQRILGADLMRPIILNSAGEIMDGYHRFAKAMLMNKPTIWAVRIHLMPPPDFKKPGLCRKKVPNGSY